MIRYVHGCTTRVLAGVFCLLHVSQPLFPLLSPPHTITGYELSGWWWHFCNWMYHVSEPSSILILPYSVNMRSIQSVWAFIPYGAIVIYCVWIVSSLYILISCFMSTLEGPHLPLNLPEAISEDQNSKFSWGSMPPHPLQITCYACDTQSQLAWPLKNKFQPWYFRLLCTPVLMTG